MATFRSQNHVPDVYVKGSRDFQLFCNLFDCVNGGIKYDIDSIPDVVDTNQCNERLMPYLQTKLGFWTNVKIKAENLRIILKGFVYAVRNKGSIKGVEQAVQLFLKIAKIKTNVHIEVINEPSNDNSLQDPYTVIIGTEERLGDTTILDEILKYILPAGYAYRYVYYADTSFENAIDYSDSVRIITGEPGLLGAVRTTYVNSEGQEIEYPLVETWESSNSKEYTKRNIIDNVNLTIVPTPDAKNPEVTDSNIGPVTTEGIIDELYVNSLIEEEEDNSGN